MYYPPFEAAIKAGAGAAVCSANKVNGVYACGNDKILNYHLRHLLGFDGFVMGDNEGVKGRPSEFNRAGTDQEQNRV